MSNDVVAIVRNGIASLKIDGSGSKYKMESGVVSNLINVQEAAKHLVSLARTGSEAEAIAAISAWFMGEKS